MSSQSATATLPSRHRLAISLIATAGLAGCAAQASHFPASHFQADYFETGAAERRAELARPRAIPLPPAELLTRTTPPSCEADAKGLPPPEGADADQAQLAHRLRLEFERDCYKAAEARTRQRLARLQAAARATSESVRKERRAR